MCKWEVDLLGCSIKIKKLRRKNKFMQAGIIDQADSLARRISKSIIRKNTAELRDVVIVTRRTCCLKWDSSSIQTRESIAPPGISVQILNNHYAAISTDSSYQPSKTTCSPSQVGCIDEVKVFHILDHLRPTATVLEGLPACFLRSVRPAFAAPNRACKRKWEYFILSSFHDT